LRRLAPRNGFRRCSRRSQPATSRWTSVRLLATHLTLKNYASLLVAARHKTKREVWQRDQGRCAYSSANRRCTETAFLEFHHVVPYVDRGAATAENIELRCRSHNQYEALLLFGSATDTVREPAAMW